MSKWIEFGGTVVNLDQMETLEHRPHWEGGTRFLVRLVGTRGVYEEPFMTVQEARTRYNEIKATLIPGN